MPASAASDSAPAADGGRLSVSMIVRDEAPLLPECLEQMRLLADEMCVADTGSTDATPQIARNFGARLIAAPWQGDFAAARNASLDLCTGDWIFIIDADERLEPEAAVQIRRHMAEGAQRAYRMLTRNYTNDTHISDFAFSEPADPWRRGFAGWHPSTKVRLFPRHPRVRFEGAVHEFVNQALLREGFTLEESPVVVHHYPLLHDAARIEAKQRMYLELGRRKLAETPDDPRLHNELGHQYVELGNYGAAAACFKEAVRRAPQQPQYMRDLGATLHLLGKQEEALRALRLAVRLRPDFGEAWRDLGVVHAAEQDWPAAETAFRKAVSCRRHDALALRYLAVALEKQGRPKKALAAAEAAHALAPADDESRALVRRLRYGRDGRIGMA